jgi:hypothetical protein
MLKRATATLSGSSSTAAYISFLPPVVHHDRQCWTISGRQGSESGGFDPCQPGGGHRAATFQATEAAACYSFVDPPVVQPVLIAEQHALEPFEVFVPAAGFVRGIRDQFDRRDAPFFALRRVVDGPVSKTGLAAGCLNRLIERFIDLLAVEHALGYPMLKPVLAFECHRRIRIRHARQFLSAVQQQRQFVPRVDQVWRLIGWSPSEQADLQILGIQLRCIETDIECRNDGCELFIIQKVSFL